MTPSDDKPISWVPKAGRTEPVVMVRVSGGGEVPGTQASADRYYENLRLRRLRNPNTTYQERS